MFVPVVLRDGNERRVRRDELQYLIVTQKVMFFRRSDGWAVLGRDQMRQQKVAYAGEDRRQHQVFAKNLWY